MGVLARRLGGEIVSVDSMQVYRGMDIGTAKPDATAQAEIRHHMLDLCDPEDEYSVAQFQIRGREVIASLHAAGRTAIIAGGSGLHFRSLVDPRNKELGSSLFQRQYSLRRYTPESDP